MLIHPELKKIHEKSTDINIDAYYLKKYSYLVNHGFFGEAKPFEFKANISENSIKENITQTKVIVFEITDYCNLKCKYCSLGDLYNFSKKESRSCLPFQARFVPFGDHDFQLAVRRVWILSFGVRCR